MNTVFFYILHLIPLCMVGYLFLREKNTKPAINSQPYNVLSFDEVNKIIDTVSEEVTDKYILYYKLKEVTIIPDMPDEIKTITTEIVSSFSENALRSFYYYYTNEYLVAMIMRKVQIVLIDYTNTNKPNTK